MVDGIRVIAARASCTAEPSNAQLEPRAVRRNRPTHSSSRELYGGTVQRTARATSCTAEPSNAQLEPRAVRRNRPTHSSSGELYGGTVQRTARAASCTAEPSNAQLEPRAVRRNRLVVHNMTLLRRRRNSGFLAEERQLNRTQATVGGSRLEVEAGVDDERPGTRRGGDAPESDVVARGTCCRTTAGAVDIHVGISEIRVVQNVDGIHSQFELLGFGDLHFLRKVHVQADVARTFNPFQPHRPELSRIRIHEKRPALAVRNGLVAELSIERLRGSDIGSGIRDLLEPAEVSHTVYH